jgi:PRTRC genetic system protein B
MNNFYVNSRLSPQAAIIIYKDRAEYSPQYFLEKREIKLVGDRYTLMAPVPLSEEQMREIAKSYVKTRAASVGFGGLIAAHLLYGLSRPGKTLVIWYRPAMVRSLNFSAALGIKGGTEVRTPALLFLADGNSLYIYALMDDNRPEAATKLYNAPFFNIYSDGRVCLGTARVGQRSTTYEGEAARFERAFFMAEQNGGNSENNCKTPLRVLWNGLIKSKASFPAKKELVQHKKFRTLGELLEQMTQGKHSNEEVYDEED